MTKELIEEVRPDKLTAEEAVKLVLKRPGMYGLTRTDEFRKVEAERDAARAALEAALAARQPTEDDREALSQLIALGHDETKSLGDWSQDYQDEMRQAADEILAAGFSRATVPDAATEKRSSAKIADLVYENASLKAERDAALAAIERCRGVLSKWESRQERNREILGRGGLGHFKAIDCTGDLRAALDGAPEPDNADPCDAEVYSWDHYRPEQIDSYWISCTLLGKHDEHEDSHTGLKWRSGLPVEGEKP